MAADIPRPVRRRTKKTQILPEVASEARAGRTLGRGEDSVETTTQGLGTGACQTLHSCRYEELKHRSVGFLIG